jgi:hypothetical protein
MEAKKAFMSTSRMARGQITGQQRLKSGDSSLLGLVQNGMRTVSVVRDQSRQTRGTGHPDNCNYIQYRRQYPIRQYSGWRQGKQNPAQLTSVIPTGKQ